MSFYLNLIQGRPIALFPQQESFKISNYPVPLK
jgi:hypothetical protein